MKKKILYVAAVLLVLALAAGGTLAYFTSRTVVHNVITTGNIQIQLVEKTTQDGEEIDWPEGGITGVMPGTAVVKKVSVKNVGTGDAWIRVKLTAQITAADGTDLTERAAEEGAVEYPLASQDWQLGEDGYYYYVNPVASGASTSNLIEEVRFATTMGNVYQNCKVNLLVEAEAVQVANNGDTVQEAQGWPEA